MKKSCEGLAFGTILLAMLITAFPVEGQPQETQIWKRLEIGNLVLSDLRPGRATLGAREIIDGIEYRHFHLQASSGRFEYKAPPGLPDTFKGRLTNVDIQGLFSLAQLSRVQPLFEVPPGQFKITLDPEVGRLEGFYGGTVELPGTRVWVENPDEIRITPETNTGTLTFRSHPVRLRQINLDLPVLGKPLQTDLVSLDPDRRSGGRFLFSFVDSSLRLVGGRFESPGRPVASGAFSGDSFDVTFGKAGAERLLAEVSEHGLEIEFQSFQAKIDSIFQFPGAPAPAVAQGNLKIGAVRGTAPFAPDRAAVAELKLDRLELVSEAAPAANGIREAATTCDESASLLTDAEIAFLASRGIPSPMTQRMRSVQAAATGLAAIPRADLALHLPRERVLQILRGSLGALAPLAETIRFGNQELLQCLSPADISSDLPALLPVELLIHYGLAIEGKELVVRPAVRLIHLPGLRLDQSIDLSSLLQQFEASAKESPQLVKAELRFPLPFQLKQAIDVTQANSPGFTVTADNAAVEAAVDQAVLLVDEQGLHLLATLR